jgi:peptidoglycan/LPS O-acetylase OafA/YrhL
VLACGVFVHHTFAAYIFHTRGNWSWSASPILNHCGQTTVAIFFMITAFLFTNKAMAARMDWKALYLSRIVRLLPLHSAIVCLVFLVVFLESSGAVREPVSVIIRELGLWLAFGRPDVNAFPMTWTLIAGVNWSLVYEALFYIAAIPMLHAITRIASLKTAVAIVLVCLCVALIRAGFRDGNAGNSLYAAYFLGGIFVAYASKMPNVSTILASTPFRVTVSAALVGCALTFMNSYNTLDTLVTVGFFAAVANGLSIFGTLKSRAILWLGDISYGIYLIHGLVLWGTLETLQVSGMLGSLDLLSFLAAMLCVGILVVVLASMSYAFFERPLILKFKRTAANGRLSATSPLPS